MKKMIVGLVVVVVALAGWNIYLTGQVRTLVAQQEATKQYALDLSKDQGFDMVYNYHMFHQIADKAGIEIEEPDFAKQ